MYGFSWLTNKVLDADVVMNTVRAVALARALAGSAKNLVAAQPPAPSSL